MEFLDLLLRNIFLKYYYYYYYYYYVLKINFLIYLNFYSSVRRDSIRQSISPILIINSFINVPKKYIRLQKITFVPTPKFVIKTKTESHPKVFINILSSSNIYGTIDKEQSNQSKWLMTNKKTVFDVKNPLVIGKEQITIDKNKSECLTFNVIASANLTDEIIKEESKELHELVININK